MEYQEGKIYKITGSGLTYYGSTINKLNDRFSHHTNHSTCSSRQIIETGEAVIVLVELFPCETLDELLWRERYFIENNKCVNIYLPIVTEEERKEKDKQTGKQWRLDNKEEQNEYNTQYRIAHKEQLNEKSIQYNLAHKVEMKEKNSIPFTCECGAIIIHRNKARHNKTKKHINYLDANKI